MTEKQTKASDAPSGRYLFAFAVSLLNPTTGQDESFGPGEVVPDWAVDIMKRRGDGMKAEPAPDVPVPGPGQSFVYQDANIDVGR